MLKMRAAVFSLFLISLLLIGCTLPQTKIYICPDGSEVDDKEKCQLPVISVAPASPSPTPTYGIPSMTIVTIPIATQREWEVKIFREINEIREENGNQPLKWSDKVAAFARAKAEEMREKEYFSHRNVELRKVGEQLKDAEIVYIVAGENLYFTSGFNESFGEDAPVLVVNGWMESPGHRSLVVDVDGLFDSAGIGAACEAGICYFVFSAVGFRSTIPFDLNPSYYTHNYLISPGLGFKKDVLMDVEINTNSSYNLYIIPAGLQQYALQQASKGLKFEYKELVSGSGPKKMQFLVTPGDIYLLQNPIESRAYPPESEILKGTLILEIINE